MTNEWDDVSYVISSVYRIAVLKRLQESPATPSQIARDTDSPMAHVSRAVNSLRDRELVDLLVSEERRKGRVYGITDHGETIWGRIEAENLA